MKRILALFISILLIIPMMFACSEEPEQKQEGKLFDIPQRIFIADGREIYTRLYSMYVSSSADDAIKTEATNLKSFMEGAEYKGVAPVGGSEYSGKIYETGDYIVTTDDEFKEAVKTAKAGEVIFVPSGVTIDLSDLFYTETFIAELEKGVILASDRGINEGGLIRFSHPSGVMLRCNDDTVITGLNISGVIAPSGERSNTRSDVGISIEGNNVTVSNCELASFSGEAIQLARKGNATVDNCFIHHSATGIKDAKSAITVTNSAFYACDVNYMKEDKDTKLPEGNGILTEKKAPAIGIERVNPDITVSVFPADLYEIYSLLSEIEAGDMSKIRTALATHSGTTNYYEYKDRISIEKDGKVYGVTNDGTPLGGGAGYENIYTTGDIVIDTTDPYDFMEIVDNAKSGQIVFIPGDMKIDLTGYEITVPAGVTLASDRGRVLDDGSISSGAMLYTTVRTETLIKLSSDSVLSGLTVVGADTERHMTHIKRGLNEAGTQYTEYYYRLALTRGVTITNAPRAEVANCEISGFSEAGIYIGSDKASQSKSVDVKVHHNFIHHNQRNGFGYGVVFYGPSYAEIYRNMFNFDRHAIAADGAAYSGYQAHDNVHMGTAIYHIFDAHGGGDRGDGTQIACEKIDMYNNAFLSDKIPYKKRGTPQEYSKFTQNVVIYPEGYYPYRYLYGKNFICEDNIFGIADPVIPDYSFEGGETFVINREDIYLYQDMESIDAKGYSLRYQYFLVFTPDGEGGYYINEYGNNLDDGSIYGWNETVYIPEGGFVITFTNFCTEGKRLYDAIQERHEVIYNTSITLDGDYIATLDENTVTVTQCK